MTDKELIQDIFRKTNIKITEDDPLVEAVISFQAVLQQNKDDFVEWANIFTSRFEDDLTLLTLKNNTKLEILEHEIKEVVQQATHEIQKKTEMVLTGFDDKAKDLNMLLTKVQVNHGRDTSDNFTKHFAKIDERYNQMLALQKQNHAFSKREVLFGVAGLVVGVVFCLLVFLVLR